MGIVAEPTESTAVDTPIVEPAARRPGLDGLRAIAVLAVVVYHADSDVLPGGFVGVDLFFVLSGYLITTLLIGEHDRSGRVSLRAFWGRRARRLWPLAWCTLAAIAVASVLGVWGADRQRTLPAEIGAAFAQVANWYQVGHGGYVSSFAAPSPIRHFWSLAIEEQFYVVWPLVLVLLLRDARFRRWAVPSGIAAIVAIALVRGWAVRPGPTATADRAYLGTDVRMVALAIGAGLAWAWRRTPMAGPSTQRWRRAIVVWGAGGAIVLAVAAAWLHADDDRLARGGFALIAIAGCGVIAATLTLPTLGAVLGARPMASLGRASYALYLTHWPLMVALGPGRSTWLRLLVGLGGGTVLAVVLHHFVELPLIRRTVRPRRWIPVGTAVAAAAIIALVVAVPDGPTPTEQVEASLGAVPDPDDTASASAPSTTASEGSGDETPAPPPSTAPPCVTAAPTTTVYAATGGFDPATVGEIADPTGECGAELKVLVVGDSTGRGAANGLAALGNPLVKLWDRTVLGCSFGDEDCPSWRERWSAAVAEIDPDVVLVYDNVVSDFQGVDDAPFLSNEAALVRTEQFIEATKVLSAQGAAVVFEAPAVPLRPNGLFFCDGDATNSNCDPAWLARWNEDLRAAAALTDATVLDVGGWIAARGATKADRPDGLHLAGPALVELAAWMVPQLFTAAGR